MISRHDRPQLGVLLVDCRLAMRGQSVAGVNRYGLPVMLRLVCRP